MVVRLARIVALVAASVVLALVWNRASGQGLALERNVFIKDGDEIIAAAEAKTRFDRGALFLDARPREIYEFAHIPGALSLPEESFTKSFAALEPELRRRFDIVVYCSGFGCEASHIVARKLKENGVPAAVLSDGWPAWTEAGYPVKQGATP